MILRVDTFGIVFLNIFICKIKYCDSISLYLFSLFFLKMHINWLMKVQSPGFVKSFQAYKKLTHFLILVYIGLIITNTNKFKHNHTWSQVTMLYLQGKKSHL